MQLLLRGEHTVGELAEACGVASPIASEHLGLLRDRGLLTRERRGRKVYYAVAEPALASILNCIETRFGAATDPPGRPKSAAKRGTRKASTG